MQTAPTTKQVLQRARALVAKKGGWTQGEYARGKSGQLVDYAGRTATCFCLDGALMRASRDTDRYARARLAVSQAMPDSDVTIIHWNDMPRRTQKQVVRLLDRAIAKTA